MDSFNSSKDIVQSNEIKTNDFISDFLIESNQECFKLCIKDFSNAQINKGELDCLSKCYSKYFCSFINVAYKFNRKLEI